jgi:hypothetical protein
MAEPVEEEDGRSSWWPKALGPVLDGTWKPPKPTVGRRTDGRGLFYPGKSHAIVGESEAGKGSAALAAVRDEIEAGHHVIYVDFEDDEASVTGRLLTLAVSPATIDDRFHYIRPEAPVPHGPLEQTWTSCCTTSRQLWPLWTASPRACRCMT